MDGEMIPNLDRGVVFVIKGPFAHFRKFYTQTSALSYGIPPRTALTGIVGAILGIPRGEVYELMQPPYGYFALQILTPIRKITSSINLLMTKGEFRNSLLGKKSPVKFFDSTKNRTQIPFEILMPQPPSFFLSYRVILWHQNQKLLEELKNRLIEHRSFFPAYFGISEFLANAEFEDTTDSAEELRNYNGEIHSVLTSDNLMENTILQPENKLAIEYILLYMNKDFSPKAHTNVTYSENAEPLKVGAKFCVKYRNFVLAPYELMNM